MRGNHRFQGNTKLRIISRSDNTFVQITKGTSFLCPSSVISSYNKLNIIIESSPVSLPHRQLKDLHTFPWKFRNMELDYERWVIVCASRPRTYEWASSKQCLKLYFRCCFFTVHRMYWVIACNRNPAWGSGLYSG